MISSCCAKFNLRTFMPEVFILFFLHLSVTWIIWSARNLAPRATLRRETAKWLRDVEIGSSGEQLVWFSVQTRITSYFVYRFAERDIAINWRRWGNIYDGRMAPLATVLPDLSGSALSWYANRCDFVLEIHSSMGRLYSFPSVSAK